MTDETGSVNVYAWIIPAFFSGSPLDHTWVTTYDNRSGQFPDIGAVIAANEHCWYCWGDFHKSGNPVAPLCTGLMDAAYAECLVRSNADSRFDPNARGTIFEYGFDGACHQLANQVLWATRDASGARLRVTGARGYLASVFVYGTYGLQGTAWDAKKASCASAVSPRRAQGGEMGGEQGDEFDEAARRILPEQKYRQLQSMRAKLQQELSSPKAKERIRSLRGEAAAAEINASINRYLDQVAEFLSAEEFHSLFGVRPGEKINIVDPKMVGAGKPIAG